jgi:hypothetical protein
MESGFLPLQLSLVDTKLKHLMPSSIQEGRAKFVRRKMITDLGKGKVWSGNILASRVQRSHAI